MMQSTLFRCFVPGIRVKGPPQQRPFSILSFSHAFTSRRHFALTDFQDMQQLHCLEEAVLFQPASEFLPMMDEVYEALLEKIEAIQGANVENNKFCISVHFRCVDEKKWHVLIEQVRSVLREYPKLRITQGRKVLEIRPPIKWDKGKALEFLLESLG